MNPALVIAALAIIGAEIAGWVAVSRRRQHRHDDRYVSWRAVDRLNGRRR